MSSPIFVSVCAPPNPPPVPACVRCGVLSAADRPHLGFLCVCVSARGARRGPSNRERCFCERMPERVCHRERKLEEKGDCGERETFPRHPQSVRLIKSHGWSESRETEPEHAGGAPCDSTRNGRSGTQRASLNMTARHMCTYLYLTPPRPPRHLPQRLMPPTRHTSLHPITPPRSSPRPRAT